MKIKTIVWMKMSLQKLAKVEGDMLTKLQQLEPEFWLRKPSIVLLMIRMVIWLNSTEIGTTIFHMLGSFDSCYVKRRTWFWIGINTGLTLLVALHCSQCNSFVLFNFKFRFTSRSGVKEYVVSQTPCNSDFIDYIAIHKS